ncbi:MAG: sigma-54 dependent transcriptional regulator, partial [Myxococcota bacterium]
KFATAPEKGKMVAADAGIFKAKPHLAGVEIHPIAGKRPLKLWPLRPQAQPSDLHPGWGTPYMVDRPTRASPGSLLAIGDRVLLLLDYRAMRDPRADRMGIIGESPSMWQVRDEIVAVARLQRPVWLHGETGVGKELVASAIHQQSSRRGGPMRVINCGAIPDTLVESVFFGHRKGAFTGANAASPGMFRDSDQGTLLLDEIGELPMEMQQKLLRVLQSGTIMPVGAAREIEVDVRVIAATWRHLDDEVQAGRFRADLFYRLSVHVVRIPALRHRREDIARLFCFFLQKRREEYNELERLFRSVEPTLPPVPMDFFVQMLTDDWSGNVRQLENVVEKLVQFNLHDGPFEPPTWQTTTAPPVEASTLVPGTPVAHMPRPNMHTSQTGAPSIPQPQLASGLMQPSNPSFTPPATYSRPAAATPASSAPHISAEDRASLVDQVLHQIGLTPPTAIKLMGAESYQGICLHFDPVTGPDTLKSLLNESLQAWLERYDYNQTHTAKALASRG